MPVSVWRRQGLIPDEHLRRPRWEGLASHAEGSSRGHQHTKPHPTKSGDEVRVSRDDQIP